MNARIFDDRACFLGEGPLWHPLRQQLFWFDIINKKLLTQAGGIKKSWDFDFIVSAAGWVDHDTLLIGSENGFVKFDIETGTHTHLADVEADNPGTRSNDGRADPWGGFWLGTMGKKAENEAGSIYRYYKGKVETLFTGITITNAICFTPDRQFAYFADTEIGIVNRVALDPQTGVPTGQPEVFLDLSGEGLNPDGAVVDASGTIWIAQWGAGRVAAYDSAGQFVREIAVSAPHSSCPAFGGENLTTLFCTTAQQGMTVAQLEAHPLAGQVFYVPDAAKGQQEHQVIL